VLEVASLTKSFGPLKAVDHISFTVAQGCCFGLLGPNGAGKTTTISVIAGTLDPDSGSVSIHGKPVTTGSNDGKRAIGYVPQDLALYGDLTARDNLSFFGSLYGLEGDELARAIDRSLEFTGLADRAKEAVKTFSGGMKRRLNIAVGVVHDPELMIFDEPTVGVDPQSRNAIFEALESLRGSGKTILYTTHYMEEVERLCDRVAVMDRGKIVAEDDLGGLHRLLPERNDVTIELETVPPADLLSRLGFEGDLDGQTLKAHLSNLGDDLPKLLSNLSSLGIVYSSVSTYRPSLEEVFLHLTGKALRD